MKKTRLSFLVKILFLLVAISFLAHEAVPHHHHDNLKVHNECCHSHDQKSEQSSCHVLNHISNVKVIAFNFKIELGSKTDLSYSSLDNSQINFSANLFQKILQRSPLLLKSQLFNAFRSLRAPPVA